MSNRIKIAYTSLAKIVLGSLCLSLLVYVSSGFLSEIFFKCVERSTPNFGTKAQLCEMYRPFFILELLTTPSAGIALEVVAFFSLSSLVVALIWNLSVVREIGIVGLTVLLVFWNYRYFAARTLLVSDFSNQKSLGPLKSVEFETKCPGRGWSCFGSDNNSPEETALPHQSPK